ncbi:MAG: 2-C-methyl-D-erythritol 4-phosphate cytidylyltransferase [bacterium]|nr:2-C-methyl-D-erythritol 4-phosphate cytidylyltransferase [bacterium]
MPAAGSGLRAGGEGRKLYEPLGDRPVLTHTLGLLQDSDLIDEILLVVRPGDEDRCRDEVLRPAGLTKVTGLIPGGANRQESVFLGLRHMGGATDLVVIHDGARPLASPGLLRRVIEAGLRDGAAVPGIAVNDTVKRVRAGTVVETVDRDGLMRIQTPQVFWFDLIWMAHSRARTAGVVASDDSGLVERLRHRVTVVEGEDENLKLTAASDLQLARAIMEARTRSGGERA